MIQDCGQKLTPRIIYITCDFSLHTLQVCNFMILGDNLAGISDHYWLIVPTNSESMVFYWEVVSYPLFLPLAELRSVLSLMSSPLEEWRQRTHVWKRNLRIGLYDFLFLTVDLSFSLEGGFLRIILLLKGRIQDNYLLLNLFCTSPSFDERITLKE